MWCILHTGTGFDSDRYSEHSPASFASRQTHACASLEPTKWLAVLDAHVCVLLFILPRVRSVSGGGGNMPSVTTAVINPSDSLSPQKSASAQPAGQLPRARDLALGEGSFLRLYFKKLAGTPLSRSSVGLKSKFMSCTFCMLLQICISLAAKGHAGPLVMLRADPDPGELPIAAPRPRRVGGMPLCPQCALLPSQCTETSRQSLPCTPCA